MMPPERSYEEAQTSISEKIGDAREKGLDLNGRNVSLSECPANLDFLSSFEKENDEYVFSDNLSPDLQIKDVLTTKGKKK